MRPTPDLVRQAIFNSLGDRVINACVLDLFSGSGALGLECLSRGASHVTGVEKVQRHAQMIRQNLAVAKLRDLPVALQRREILKWLRMRQITNVGFDVVESVRSLLNQDLRVAKVNLPQNRHVRRRAGKIFIE